MYIFCNFRTISIILLMVELYVLFLYCRITCIFYYMYCQNNVLFCIVQLLVMISYHLIWCLLLKAALNTINKPSSNTRVIFAKLSNFMWYVAIVDLYIIIYYCLIVCINFLIKNFIANKIWYFTKSERIISL